MVGVGDSISAGAFADTSTLMEDPFPWGLPIPNPDSLLDQFGFISDIETKRTLSWVSGLVIDSHYQRLHDYLKPQNKTLTVLNFAQSGAVSSELFEQVEEIQTALKFGVFNSVPYITMLVGANDLCKSVPIETFHKNVHQLFEKFAELHPADGQPIHILVSSVPKIADLGEPRVMEYRTTAGYRCKLIRTTPLSVCRRMTNWTTEEEHQKLNAEIDQVNEILRAETNEAARKFPQLQTFYSPTFSQQQLNPEDLAMDCFHPNANGQAKIAELLWQDQPWFH